MITLLDVEKARQRLAQSIKITPCQELEGLSKERRGKIALKLENLQHTGSFKARGALNRLLDLSPDECARGVIAASAGNHAQGLAYHATRLGINATIVMPANTPLIKVTRTVNYGAQVILHGDNYDAAYDEAQRIAAEKNLVYVHAYDDDLIMSGQGTIGLEILEQFPEVDTIVVPVGGGGLIAGIATAVKAKKPQVRIIGVESSAVPSMAVAIAQGGPVRLPAAGTIAEGIAVRQVGQRCHDVCRELVDRWVTVEDDQIARAILHLLEQAKTVAEGAGAAAFAAVLARKIDVESKNVCVVICGGNIDVNVLSRIIDRGLVESGRLARLKVWVPDRPGSLAELLSKIATHRANIIEVHHERAFGGGGLGQVRIDLTVETRGADHIDELLRALQEKNYRCERLHDM